MPPDLISSLHNPRIKETLKLRDRKGRLTQGRTLVDGAREILLALQAGVELVELFVCDERCRSDVARAAVARVVADGGRMIHVTPAVYEKLAFGERDEGVLAVVATRRRGLDDLHLPANPFVAVLEGIEKPGNLGAMLRSADAAGVHALIVTGGGTDLDNPNTIRASVGTVFRQPVAIADGLETLDWLRSRGMKLYAARVDAVRLYSEADFRAPSAVILGSEAEGLDPRWHAPDIIPIKLPMRGLADSLNVSATAAVLFYEAWRQRQAESSRGE